MLDQELEEFSVQIKKCQEDLKKISEIQKNISSREIRNHFDMATSLLSKPFVTSRDQLDQIRKFSSDSKV